MVPALDPARPVWQGKVLLAWVAFVALAILGLELFAGPSYGWVVLAAATAFGAAVHVLLRRTDAMVYLRWSPQARDLAAVLASYALVVAGFVLAFRVFTTGDTLGLFLSFAAAMLVGFVGPVWYTVWMRKAPLAEVGLGGGRWRRALGLGILFAALQSAITLWAFDFPRPVDWVPLLAMGLTVGAFEAVYFRGFVQERLERSFGVAPAVVGASALYALYHVGYGMAGAEMLFLFGLGLVYSLAYQLARNVLVLWPLLLPLGSFYNTLSSGDLEGQLPWISILGFLDVLGLMGAALFLARRRRRKQAAQAAP